MASHGTGIDLTVYLAVLFILTLSWQRLVTCSLEDEYNPDYDDLLAADKRHLGSVAASAGGRTFGFTNSRVSHFSPKEGSYGEDADAMKFKRFLGTLARGGWFPRQFRGFVHPSALTFQKRHIGAVARLGWLPYKSKEENSL